MPVSFVQRMRARAAVVTGLRAYFQQNQFIEVDTPLLLRAPAPERFIDAIGVALAAGMGGQAAERRYLQASPELAMKMLLAAGLERIFQIAPAFRDGDYSRRHCPEFRLLEWYRAGGTWHDGMADCEGMLRSCLAAMRQAAPSWPAPAWAEALLRGQPLPRLRFGDAIGRYAGIELAHASSAAALYAAVRARGLHAELGDSYDELCHRMWVAKVEPGLASERRAVLITHFPAPMAGFAALCDDEPAVCQRFELCVGDLELCNGFTELRCPAELERRFTAEAQVRLQRGKEVYPRADGYFAALPTMPAAMGVALGVERLLMALLATHTLDEVCFVRFADV